MSGKGKYTTYVPPKSTRRSFFEKLFKGSGKEWVPTVGSTDETPPFVGLDQAQAAKAAAKAGNEIMRATLNGGITAGDLNQFPMGVDLSYSGKVATIQPPDTEAGKDDAWSRPGDPANSYVPDLTSPGPGKTLGIEKDLDPKIASSDIKPNYVPGAPDTGTKSPSTVSGKVYDANTLGTDLPKGQSGAD